MLVVLVVVLAVVASGALAFALVNRRRLHEQRAMTSSAEERAAAGNAELSAKVTELELATKERASAEERAATLAEQARLAEERTTAAEEQARTAEEEARAAAERAQAAESVAAAQRAAAAGSGSDGVDPDVLWILEQARSERTWRFSVAPSPESESVFAGTLNPLMAALQVELDAAREDVGTVVDLDAEIPGGLTVAASVLTLRASQELLADVVRRSEETTLRVRADGDDLVIEVDSRDEDGEPVLPSALPIPPSPSVDLTPTGVRIHHAFTVTD